MKKENPAKKFEKCLDISDRFDLFFTERVSYPFALLFNKMGMHPNFVTILNGLFGIAGAVLFIFNNLICTIVGIFLVIMCAILDCADGQVARMSHKGSLFGRTLDGLIDSVVYISIYVCLGIRLMSANIPFTETQWSFWIFLIIVPYGLIFHTSQCRTADYYRNAHMYLSASERGSELTYSGDIEKIVQENKKPFYKFFVMNSYLTYTKTQERETPKLQKLLALIRQNNRVIPTEVSDYYRSESNKICRLANSLVFNVRSYTLFALLLLTEILKVTGVSTFSWEILIFPIVLLTLEPIKIFLRIRYEKIAEKATEIMESVMKEKENNDGK